MPIKVTMTVNPTTLDKLKHLIRNQSVQRQAEIHIMLYEIRLQLLEELSALPDRKPPYGDLP